ncbi:MAG TPA: class I SAM-dependent methyltransferase [Candidatus Ozemobacteraceae bacterium]|nr:class I SAM-dependent methyltransferase [Candidatus Ozemobacteraceae bacterium]
MMMKGLLDRLRLPGAKELPGLDDEAAARVFRKILNRKPYLRALYSRFYRILLKEAGTCTPLVELGSGSGFLPRIAPAVIASDILPAPDLDLRCSALELPFRCDSVGAFLMFDVFHHVKDAGAFLAEMHRALKPGGRIVMIEPAATPFARFIYGRFHHEPFDPQAGWTIPGGGPRSGANGALPWIVFMRDRPRLEREFPGLRLKPPSLHTPFSYLVSGGLSFRQFLPGWTEPAIAFLERRLVPVMSLLAMFMTVTLEKDVSR